MKKIVSNKPFSGKNSLRAGAGPVYLRIKPTERISSNTENVKVKKVLCFGIYDNLVGYVWEVDLTNGNHIAYVDCDYVE
jgi:hypothetical protein